MKNLPSLPLLPQTVGILSSSMLPLDTIAPQQMTCSHTRSHATVGKYEQENQDQYTDEQLVFPE